MIQGEIGSVRNNLKELMIDEDKILVSAVMTEGFTPDKMLLLFQSRLYQTSLTCYDDSAAFLV